MGLIAWFQEARERWKLHGASNAHFMERRVNGKVEHHFFRLWNGRQIEFFSGAPGRYGRPMTGGSVNVAGALADIQKHLALMLKEGFAEVEGPDWWKKGEYPPVAEGPEFFEDPDHHEWDDVKVKEADTWTHSGMYLLWLDSRGLLDLPADEADLAKLALARNRQLTPGAYFGAVQGGWFGPDELTDDGLAFTRSYYNDKGYKADYRAHVLKPRSNFYSGADTWERYDVLAPVLDQRYEAWKEAQQMH